MSYTAVGLLRKNLGWRGRGEIRVFKHDLGKLHQLRGTPPGPIGVGVRKISTRFRGGARKILTSFEGGEKKFDEV